MGLGQGERGYAMAALLVGMTVMAVLMSAAMPVWSHYAQREKEEELIWRGQQYARAIGLFQRKYANTFPPTVDVLVEQKFLRKKYKDPVTGEDFQPIPATGMPGGGVIAPPGMPAVPGATQPAPGQPRSAPPVGQQRSPARMTSVGTTVQGGIGIQGVVSKSDKTSIKIFNGRTKYNEWAFVYMATAQAPGAVGFPGQPGVPVPIQPGIFGQPGQPGTPGQPGRFGQPIPGQPMPGPGGTTFTPLGGTDRRPGLPSGMTPAGPGGAPPGGPPRQPSPFGPRPPRPPGG
ncbi:MAG TPA: type II secretion system protein [Vicinamibacterales bacterium]|nr:type II secretion system protein [Vicinamibacterales bacterium]